MHLLNQEALTKPEQAYSPCFFQSILSDVREPVPDLSGVFNRQVSLQAQLCFGENNDAISTSHRRSVRIGCADDHVRTASVAKLDGQSEPLKAELIASSSAEDNIEASDLFRLGSPGERTRTGHHASSEGQ